MADQSEQADSNSQSEDVKGETQEQAPSEEPYFPDLKLGKAWGESITKQGADKLEARLLQWATEADHGRRMGPFDNWSDEDVVPFSGAEVFWVAARTSAGTSDVQAVAEMAELLLRGMYPKPERGFVYLPEDPSLDNLHLEGACLHNAYLEGAYLHGAHLAGAHLLGAHLKGANLGEAHLEGAILRGARLEGANLRGARLEGANLRGAHLRRANLNAARAKWVTLIDAHLENADLTWAVLEKARLEGADLREARLEGTDLREARLEGADLNQTQLEGVLLSRATFDYITNLTDIVLTDTPHWYSAFLKRTRHERIYGPVSLADVHWNDVDLTVVDWSRMRRLGDERSKRRWWRTREESERATRANTQLAKQLRDAGLNDDADRFAYRAQVCQRGVHLLRLRFGRWLFSWLLFVVAGYGYRPLRTLFWYLAVIFGFAAVFFSVGPGAGVPLSPLGSLVFSITSFHGRGFFPGGSPGHSVTLDDPLTVMAAMEAVVGLFIEISFIATFTQRYFGK